MQFARIDTAALEFGAPASTPRKSAARKSASIKAARSPAAFSAFAGRASGALTDAWRPAPVEGLPPAPPLGLLYAVSSTERRAVCLREGARERR